MKYLYLSFLTMLMLVRCGFLPKESPKTEFRGAWLATVANIDWPKSPTDSPEKQKKDLLRLFDGLRVSGINAIIFQIRPECDALYRSNYEPWSYWLTGEQGKAPQPYYDPLQFAIEQAHKRGMELHAWFNPFRAERKVGTFSLAANHIVNRHPEWILNFKQGNGTLRILNPGIPAVRRYITQVVSDVIRRYDVDGIHFDDYFYPYPPNDIAQTQKDSTTFKTFKHGDSTDLSIDAWRRANVNRLISMIHDSIQAIKPWIKFGISPFGIYRLGMPPGISGMDAYSKIYCDPLAWLKKGTIDYITPQLYWKIGGPQDFKKLVDWWADQAHRYDRHLYVGHIFGRRFSKDELPRQLEYVRHKINVRGDVYFSAKHFLLNTLNFVRRIKEDFYRYPALVPPMSWKKARCPEAPTDFVFARTNGLSTAVFQWRAPKGEGMNRYSRFVLYRFLQKPVDHNPPQEAAYIYEITGDTIYKPPMPKDTLGHAYFAVSAINRGGRESRMSKTIEVWLPKKVSILKPKAYMAAGDSVWLQWRLLDKAASYHVQVAEDPLFEKIVKDTTGPFAGELKMEHLTGLQAYFWRVAALNPVGQGIYSEAGSFFSLVPPKPNLESPQEGEMLAPENWRFSWQSNAAAECYRLQIGYFRPFPLTNIKLDTVVVDTSLSVPFVPNSQSGWYYWRVKALNAFGEGNWSGIRVFKTGWLSGLGY